ncbi:MAG: type II 3-dehydroquinate dehydratase [Bacteroidales bacterium]|jgi:3-dehydroquinate dehydratase-2|nr:type II 3-dehydroquinate dehydratase [Bacteroidales bacterium]
MKILIINGVNLNLLGKREPQIYGTLSFENYYQKLKNYYQNVDLELFTSNSETDLINCIQVSDGVYDAIVLNAGAFTHTSIALSDAVKSVQVPVIEVHISNVYAREYFRQTSFLSPVCKGCISGFGLESYRLAIESIVKKLL